LRGGRMEMAGRTLQDLIIAAYLVHNSQLVGVEPWMTSERYDIRAVIEHPPSSTNEVRMQLLKSMLADRFGLRVHTEARDREAFVLRQAKPGHPLGRGIQPSQTRCDGVSAAQRRANTREGWPPCGAADIKNMPAPDGRGEITHQRWSAVPLDQYTAVLVAAVGEPVANETGLDGRFDIEVEYARPLPGGTIGDIPEGPTLPVALEEQLGLRLERHRAPVPVLVIDRAARPSTD
jgi:uncharacterized protein (TIGR03435 family)